MARFPVIDPSTEQVLGEFPEAGEAEVADAVSALRVGQADWAALGAEARAGYLVDLAKVLRARRDDIAATMSREMGKPLTEALAEVDKGAAQALLLASQGPGWLADETVALETRTAVVRAVPRGVVAAITPWNFPLWQALRSLMPALLAGNTCALKPAPQGTMTALALRRAFEEAQLPRGVLRVLTGGAATGEALVRAPVDVVVFTGSQSAGKRVAAVAAEGLKTCVLEMGGSDPFVVLADADLDLAVRLATEGRFRNAGQICISAKRFFVEQPIAAAFRDRFAKAAAKLRVGDALDPATQMGPLVTQQQRERLQAQVGASIAAGARVLTGGRALERKGWFFAPTVLDHVTPDMPVMREETFGPVAPLMAVRDAAEAVRLANAGDFGLGATVVGGARAPEVAAQLQAGLVGVNGLVTSDVRFPFGGVKGSGLGRELGRDGVRALCDLRVLLK